MGQRTQQCEQQREGQRHVDDGRNEDSDRGQTAQQHQVQRHQEPVDQQVIAPARLGQLVLGFGVQHAHRNQRDRQIAQPASSP